MTKVKIVSLKYIAFVFIVVVNLIGCSNEEIAPYPSECEKYFNADYLEKLSQKDDIDSARELTRLYLECNDGEEKYDKDMLYWSEKLMSYESANKEDLKMYRIIRGLSIDTGESLDKK